MIFVTLGSQKFQFNRLLQEIDELVRRGIITEDLFAQTGYSDYVPCNYQYKNFLNRDEFSELEAGADIVCPACHCSYHNSIDIRVCLSD